MARRKQALELELDHERKVLELRRRFEAPVTKREPSLAAAKISYSPAQQDVFDAHTYPSEETVRPKDTSVAKESDPQKGALNSVQELKIIGDSQKSPNAPQEPVQRNDAGQKSPTKSEPSDILNRLLGSPPDPSTQNRPRRNLEQNKRPEHPMSETKNRPVSERSSLVHIKTSVSPISATAREPVAPITAKDRQEDKGHRRRPTVKHLTCYFWKNGNCTKRADECSYAHHDTGYTAMAPESLKRMRNDGSYYRRGAWKR